MDNVGTFTYRVDYLGSMQVLCKSTVAMSGTDLAVPYISCLSSV